MRADYNPFDKKVVESTEHGVINYQHSLGTVYVTHRRKEHFFKKFRGFGISISELEIAYEKRVHWVMFVYHRDDGSSIPYRVLLNDLHMMEEYDNDGDVQKVVPIVDMEKMEKGVWVQA